MDSYFLAETVKYLYLIFDDSDYTKDFRKEKNYTKNYNKNCNKDVLP